MSRIGLKVAKLFGKKLPAFLSESEAQGALFAFRDSRLHKMQEISKSGTRFADYTPESLKELEKLYFELIEFKGFDKIESTTQEFEECMAMYYGEVYVRNVSKAVWVVEEFAFEHGKFEIGVRMGNLTIMLSRMKDHFKTRENKRKQSIWREYKRHSI